MSDVPDFRQQFAGFMVPELFDLAARQAEEPPPEDEGPHGFHWGAIQELQAIGTREVLEAAAGYARRGSPAYRAAAALVLGQLGKRAKSFHEERLELAITLATRDPEDKVLEAAAFALGHLADERGREPLLRLRHHPSADVRFAVAGGLANCAHMDSEGETDDPQVVDALIELTRDVHEEVRNWATFGLARQVSTDTAAIREALSERLADPYDEVRAEAIAGLALRHDERSVIPGLELLQTGPVPSGVLDALREAGDDRFAEELKHYE